MLCSTKRKKCVCVRERECACCVCVCVFEKARERKREREREREKGRESHLALMTIMARSGFTLHRIMLAWQNKLSDNLPFA